MQGPRGDEALAGLDRYEQMLNTFAEQAKGLLEDVEPARRTDDPRYRCLDWDATCAATVA